MQNVSKQFAGGVRALDGLSLEVADGERITVVGPSGSGKSTLLRVIAGLESPSGGEIVIGDRRVNGLPPRGRDVAMAFQSPALFPHLSVRANLAFAGRLRKLPKAELQSRIADAARLLGIESLLDRRPDGLSGGERQRVALGRVLVRGAACNLLDEPLAHLDIPLALQLRTCLLEIHAQRPTTTLHVTHDQQEALALGDRVLVLAAGQARQLGAPREIFQRPADRFVASFFGAPGMQFFEGRLVGEGDCVWLEAGAVRLPIDPGSLGARLENGAMIVAGVRPTAISLANGHATDGACAAVVKLVEQDPRRTLCYLETRDGQKLIAETPVNDFRASDWPAIGAEAAIRIDTSAMHFFEPGERGKRL